MVKLIKRQSTLIWLPDEFSSFLLKLADPRVNVCEKEINERMRELWSKGHNSPYSSSEGASEGDDMEFIVNPHFNVVGFGNRTEFFAACKGEDIPNGFLNRLGPVEEPTLIKVRGDFEMMDLPPKLVIRLMKIRDLKRRRLEWTPGAKAVWQAECDWVSSVADEVQRDLWSRSPEKLVRAASSLAVSRLDTTVTQSDMDLAKVLLTRSNAVFQAGLDDAAGKRLHDHAGLRVEIARRLKSHFPDGASPAELKRSFKNNTKMKRSMDDALEDMVACGTITKLERVETGGRAKYVHRLIEE